MGEYRPAAVCQNGHPLTADVGTQPDLLERAGLLKNGQIIDPPDSQPPPTAGYCPHCAARVLIGCASCGEMIRGRWYETGVLVLSPPRYRPPPFCDYCGEAHPWANRQALLRQLETLLTHENEGLTRAEKLALHERFEKLRAGQLDENQEVRYWKFIKSKAPELARIGKQILPTVLSESVKKAIELA